MTDGDSRTEALRASGLVEAGLDPTFDRLAHLGVLATRAPVCVIVIGDSGLVKGYSGPEDSALISAVTQTDFPAFLLAANSPPFAARDELAGAVIRAPSGLKVGCVCVRTAAPRTWTPEALAALTDLAELASSEVLLRTRRRPDERTAAILENVSDACVFLDRDFRYTLVNRKAGEIFGRDPAELIGKHIWTEFPEGVGQPFYHAYNRAMEEQIPSRLEGFYPPWNRWFENRIYPSPEGLAIFFQDVTERRSAELERQRLAAIVSTEPDTVAIADADGNVLFLNAAGRSVLGIGQSAPLSSVHLVAMHAPSARDVVCDAMPQALKGIAWSGESALLNGQGKRVPVHETIAWHPGQAPDAGFFSLIARDVSERKQLTQEIERSAALRAQTEGLAHLGYWVWEVMPNRVTWSPELYRIYGLDLKTFPASFEGYLARLHPGDRDRVRGIIESALRDRTPFSFEERIIRPDGEIRYLRSWGSVNVTAEGQPAELFGTCLDITELVQAREELRRARDWLGTALRDTHVAVWEWNPHTNDVKFSDDAYTVLGIGQEKLGVSFDAYLHHIHPDDRAPFMEALRACSGDGKDLDSEHRLVAPDRPDRWIVTRGRAHRDASGRIDHLLGTMVDVTERHRTEDERRRLVEKLGHAQKMDAIGRLSAGIAHDLNNVLTIVQGSVEEIRVGNSLSSTAESGVRHIEEAVRSGAALTGQLLSFSRDRAGPPSARALDLNAVVQASCQLLGRLLPPNVTLELSLAPDLPKVMSDREHLERVLLNLITNARDAMPDGGRLTIETLSEQRHAVLRVRDTGTGMTPEVRARAFEPFFTTKEPGRGTGLGLSTVYGIVSQNGGTVDVESAPGRGTSFIVRLPFAA